MTDTVTDQMEMTDTVTEMTVRVTVLTDTPGVGHSPVRLSLPVSPSNNPLFARDNPFTGVLLAVMGGACQLPRECNGGGGGSQGEGG